MSVVTLLTVQNTQRVDRVELISPELVLQQLDCVLSDIPPQAIKTGALGNSQIIDCIAPKLHQSTVPIVIDPVMVSKHGQSLVASDFVGTLQRLLLPHAFLITPNRFEAEQLSGLKISSISQARQAALVIQSKGPKNVLVKYGQDQDDYVCVLARGQQLSGIRQALARTNSNHGSGCVVAALVTAKLALGYTDLEEIIQYAMAQLSAALSIQVKLGYGIHPVETRLLRD